MSLSDAIAADALFVLHRSGEGPLGHPSNVLKAVRWLVRTLEPDPFPDLWSSIFGTFSCAGSVERKESVPLPCAFLAWLEQCILDSSFGDDVIAFAGGILVCCHASLRFSDSQHVDWSSFVLDHAVFRAVSFRTKTSRAGCPFGFLCAGFWGVSQLSHSWVGGYLNCLRRFWMRLLSFAPQATSDCIFFSCGSDTFVPLSYASALKTLRMLLFNWGGRSDPSVYTLRSMKTTMLSWMSQVGVPEELRAMQGHHRQSSAQLYSRDDVFPELRAQKLWWEAFFRGFRPLTPQHRRGQRPLQEPALPTAPSPAVAFDLQLDLLCGNQESKVLPIFCQTLPALCLLLSVFFQSRSPCQCQAILRFRPLRGQRCGMLRSSSGRFACSACSSSKLSCVRLCMFFCWVS